ncbi:DUF4864 domain-containing protein [Allorhodopirellula solitaria]|uniref:Uncharacterized protein n=1 Tax=Allorhodopirellula solitaria TaxID=2527987 RepID=A0A5C5XT56_9BACT|nr:hypothetical protein [Allorhodopirellula solitaria]TWT66090.1 hypothetical protein CA85_29540 [Allorhodopirellula solitaria]
MNRRLQTRRFMGAAVGLMIGVALAVFCFFVWRPFTGATTKVVEQQAEGRQFLDEDGFDPDVADPSYAPQDVAELQLASLQKAIADPAQLKVCYSLASPENRALTGPLSRFVNLFRLPAYRPLLGHQLSMIGRVRVRGDQADMMVSVVAEDGQAYAFQFLLSRQRSDVEGPDTVYDVGVVSGGETPEDTADVRPIDDSEKCWLTHSVYPVPVATIVPTRTTEP